MFALNYKVLEYIQKDSLFVYYQSLRSSNVFLKELPSLNMFSRTKKLENFRHKIFGENINTYNCLVFGSDWIPCHC